MSLRSPNVCAERDVQSTTSFSDLIDHCMIRIAYPQNFWSFLLRLNEAAKDRKRSSVLPPKEGCVAALLKLLETLLDWTKTIEPVDQPRRFGNVAFKTFHSRLVAESETLLEAVCGAHSAELSHYLNGAFGSEVRLDYGTGHEASFFVLLFCLDQVGLVSHPDYPALVLVVLPAYLAVSRAVQTRYMLEPAGSRGVWGLDDYSFLPFIFGSAQLLTNRRVQPDFMVNRTTMEEYRQEFLYVDAVAYITDYKKGPFHEHSPTLWDISAKPWKKINQGMLKMYKAEVLSKLPVMQHFLFGEIFPFPKVKASALPTPPVVAKSGGPGGERDPMADY